MSGRGRNPNPNQNKLLNDSSMLQHYFEVQKDKIQLDTKKLEYNKERNKLREKQIANAHEFNMKSLDVQEKVLVTEANNEGNLLNKKLIAGIIVLSMIICFFSFAMYIGETELVKYVLERACYILGGAGGGYAISKVENKSNKSKNDNPEFEGVEEIHED